MTWNDIIEAVKKTKEWLDENKDDVAKALRKIATTLNSIADFIDPVE